ncbi:MAG: hypothetical protein MUO38_08080 [Anaerolineales bacterium]|nr:hypothetical protein [Anaerolineales bacterium]
MNTGETRATQDQKRLQVRMDVEAGSLTGQALPPFRSPAGSVEDPAPPGTARHTVPAPPRCFFTAPPGTDRHIVPTQHLRDWAGVSFGRAGVRCGAGVQGCR